MAVINYADQRFRQQLYEHFKHEVEHSTNDTRRNRLYENIYSQAADFLCTVEPRYRLCQSVTKVIDVAVKNDPRWDLVAAVQAFQHLEKYTWNLLDYPWKQEFHMIRAYSGFVKLQIEPFVPEFGILLKMIGYKLDESGETFTMVTSPLEANVWLSVMAAAFELYLATVELKICSEIHKMISMDNDVTTADVWYSRCRKIGYPATFIQLFEAKRQKVSSRRERSSVITVSEKGDDDQQSYDRSGYLTPRSTKSVNGSTHKSDQISRRMVAADVHEVPNQRVERHTISSSYDSNSYVSESDECSSQSSLVRHDHKRHYNDRSDSCKDVVSHAGRSRTCNESTFQTWQCSSPKCQAINSVACGRCSMCSKPRQSSNTLPAATRRHDSSPDKSAADGQWNVQRSYSETSKHQSSVNGHQGSRNETGAKQLPISNTNGRSAERIPHARALLSWNCTVCGTSNSVHSVLCTGCSSSNPDASLDIDPVGWQCAWCTFVNKEAKSACTMCRNNRYSVPPSQK